MWVYIVKFLIFYFCWTFLLNIKKIVLWCRIYDRRKLPEDNKAHVLPVKKYCPHHLVGAEFFFNLLFHLFSLVYKFYHFLICPGHLLLSFPFFLSFSCLFLIYSIFLYLNSHSFFLLCLFFFTCFLTLLTVLLFLFLERG